MAESPGVTLAKSGIAIAVLVAAMSLLGIQFGATALFTTLLLFAALALATDASGNISVSFVVVGFAVTILLIQLFAPDVIFEQIDTLLRDLGFPILGMNAVVLVFWAVVAVLTAWVVDIRFISGTAKKPNTVAKRVSSRAERLVQEYATLGRVIAVGAAGIVVVILNQTGLLAGDLSEPLAQAPSVLASVFAGVFGYLSLGGALPVVGRIRILEGIPPVLWAAIVGTVIVLAWGVRNQ